MVKMPMMMIMMKRAMMMMEEMMVAPGKAGHAEEEGDGEEDVRHKAEQHRAPVDLKQEDDDWEEE